MARAASGVEGDLRPSQERQWFRAWIAALVVLYAGTSLLLTLSQWRAREEAQVRHTERLTPAGAAAPGARRIASGILLERISELSVAESRWIADFQVWFRYEPGGASPASQLAIANGDLLEREPIVQRRTSEGVYERHRVRAVLHKPFTIARFPLDDHQLTIDLEVAGTERDALVFVPDARDSGVAPEAAAPGYRLGPARVVERIQRHASALGDPTRDGTVERSMLRFAVPIGRPGLGFYAKLFQALFLAVGISLLALWIRPTHVDPRFGLGVGALFAAVANTYLVGSQIPPSGEFTLADLVNLLGIATISVVLLESVVSLHLDDSHGEHRLARRLDRASFAVIASGYLLVNILLALAAFER